MADVEILWPESLDTEELLGAAAVLQGAGVDTQCLSQPVRRGGLLEALVMVATPAMGPFLKALFEKVGADGYEALRDFVKRLLTKRHPHKNENAAAPTAVVFESKATGAQFVFTPGLPDEAYRAALTVEPGATGGRWVWDSSAQAWLEFEKGQA